MSPKRFALISAMALAAPMASSLRAEAQVIYPFPPYRMAMYDSSVRLDVTPREAEVFVDGYYAGIVDDFDGMWQRLRVEPGQHEITVYRDGYRIYRQRVYLTRDRTFKIKVQLEPLAPGELGEGRPVPSSPATGVQAPRPLPTGQAPAAQPFTGRLLIQIQPADASLIIDGQPWPLGPEQDRAVLDLPEGRHVIQVRKTGYVGYLTETQVRRGETTTVNVNLRTEP